MPAARRGDLEARGIRRSRALERAGPNRARLAESLAHATAEQQRVRAELAAGELGPDEGASLELGIGGSRNPEQLKCLHAHVAFALARPGYELGERILAEIDPLWPRTCCMNARGVAVSSGAPT